jgi:hypothetical protein
MGGKIQQFYTHEVPKTVAHKSGKRINITFRMLKKN